MQQAGHSIATGTCTAFVGVLASRTPFSLSLSPLCLVYIYLFGDGWLGMHGCMDGCISQALPSSTTPFLFIWEGGWEGGEEHCQASGARGDVLDGTQAGRQVGT